MDTNAPGAPRRARTAERMRKALDLRIGGMSYQAIGDVLGISPQAVYNLVDKAIKATKALSSVAAEELKEQELECLNTAKAAIWNSVLKGDIQAGNLLVKYMARRAALLGLDAPAKTEVAMSWRTEAEALGYDTAEIESAAKAAAAGLDCAGDAGLPAVAAEPKK